MKRSNGKRIKTCVILMAWAPMIIFMLAGCRSVGTKEPETEGVDQAEEESRQMPVFASQDLSGNEITEDIFSEKDLTVLNVWGTFCPPCIGEMPELGEWAKEMPDNVQIIGLICDIAGEEDKEHRELAKEILEKAGADFTQIVADSQWAPLLKEVTGVPTTFFVDGDGRLVGEPIIGADVEGYREFVKAYLDGQ